MIVPKFVWTDAIGATELIPTYPPVGKTGAAELEAQRHDSITTTGVKQSITDRTDQFLSLDFKWVPSGDMAQWTRFMNWAIAGGVFTYYPNMDDVATFADYTLEDDRWVPKRVAFMTYGFSLRIRKWVA